MNMGAKEWFGRRRYKAALWAHDKVNYIASKVPYSGVKRGRENFRAYARTRGKEIKNLKEKVESGKLSSGEAVGARMFGMKGYGTAFAESQESKSFGSILFIIFALMGFLPLFRYTVTGEIPPGLGWTMFIVFFFSTFVGFFGGRTSRPPMGIIVMTFMLFSFSFTYTDTVGATVFGPWWGTIQNTGELFFTPVSEAFTTLNCQTGASFSCITEGPISCNQKRLECNKRVAQLEGTTQAIEFTTINLQPKEAESEKSAIGYIEIENRGDWDAENVKLIVKDPTAEDNRRRLIDVKVGKAQVNTCIGGEPEGTNACVFTGVLAKYDKGSGGGKGAMQFTLDWKDFNNIYYSLLQQKVVEGDQGASDKINVKGQYVNLTFEVRYHYKVDSTYAIDVRTQEELKELLQRGTTLSGTQARYSGGPVVASIWTPTYVESGKPTIVTAALTNTRNGFATNAKYCLFLSPDVKPVKEVAGTDATLPTAAAVQPETLKWIGATEDATGCDTKGRESLTVIKCDFGGKALAKPGTKGSSSQACTFYIQSDVTDKKRIGIVGEAEFDYSITKTNKEIGILG